MLTMPLFSSAFRRLFDRFAHFLRGRETAQCQESEKLPEAPLMKARESEAFNFTSNDRKSRKRHRKVPERCQLGQRAEEINKGGNKDEAEEERETLRLEKKKKNGRVHQRKRKMQSLEKLMEREAGESSQVTKPMPLLVEVKPLHSPFRSSFLKPTELPMLPSVSEHLALPADRFKPLPPVTKPAKDVLSLLHVDPPKLLAVPPRPTPAPDELFFLRCSSSQVRPPKQIPPASDQVVTLQRPPSRKPPLLTSSPFEPLPELVLVDIEDEESEYVKFTGKTIQARDSLQPERSQMPEAEMKPRRMVAWMEEDSETQEEVWTSEVEEVQRFEEKDPNEMGQSKAIRGQTSPDSPKKETQHNANVQERGKRKVPVVLFSWIQVKDKKRR